MVVASWLATLLVVVIVPAAPARAADSGPVGAFDEISVRLPGLPFQAPGNANYRWEISGWAADPDSPGRSTKLRVFVDGQQVTPDGVLYTTDSRPDVDAAVPFAGPNSGWHTDVFFPDTVPHTVCVDAINFGDESRHAPLGCKTFAAFGGTSIADPQGNLEAMTATPGLVRFQGWAGDGDVPANESTVMRVVEDGMPWDGVGPSYLRPDVHAAFPAFRNAAGYDFSLPVVPGKHIFCVDLGNGGRNGLANTSLGCRLLDVPGVQAPTGQQARGQLERLRYDSGATDGTSIHWVAQGWAWDPKSPANANVTLLEVASTTISFDGAIFDQTTTGDSRPDVPQSNPGAPVDTGFHRDVYPSDNPPGFVKYVCAYVSDGPDQRFIGCRDTANG